MAQPDTLPRHGSTPALIRALVSLVVWLAIMIAALFGSAGTWDWPRGWMFFGAYCLLTAIACVWLWIVNPEIFAARSKIQKGTKGWDRILTYFIILAFIAILPVAALDDGRFHWAPQPDWVVLLGYLMLAPGFMGFAWAQSVNRNFEATVRIQTDRGHNVITTGPYAIVRHPGYIFAIFMILGMALALGSLYALIPAGILVLLVLVRTLGEDATLKAELPGYAEYAARVKQRWIPGVW
jgi:protein-S-isoprenylcysteine O-methyltransferase Ste14